MSGRKCLLCQRAVMGDGWKYCYWCLRSITAQRLRRRLDRYVAPRRPLSELELRYAHGDR